MSDVLIRPERNSFRVFQNVSTRWADNDAYGHVNNVVYYAWFDTVVNATLIGLGLLEVAGDGPIFLVAETRCRYFASLSFPEPVTVGLAVERLGTSSITYKLGVFGDDQEAAAAGRFVHVCVDRATRRSTPIPAALRDRLAAELA